MKQLFSEQNSLKCNLILQSKLSCSTINSQHNLLNGAANAELFSTSASELHEATPPLKHLEDLADLLMMSPLDCEFPLHSKLFTPSLLRTPK